MAKKHKNDSSFYIFIGGEEIEIICEAEVVNKSTPVEKKTV